MSSAGPIRVVLSDDHEVVRSGLRVLLETDVRFVVVGEAGDLGTTRATVEAERPQVLVLDLNLGGESSLELVPELRRDHPQTQIVVLTMQDNPGFAQAALRSGAIGYVLKDAVGAELMDAISAAAAGQSYLNPKLGARLAAASGGDGQEDQDRLTARESQILKLIALGHTNPEIAAGLSLSVRTVESHRAHIQQKTGLTSRSQLVTYAHERQLLG